MSIRIFIGDMRERVADLPDDSFDCVIADPPYGETSLTWDSWVVGWPTVIRRVLKPNGSMWVFGSQRMFLNRSDEFTGWKFSHDVVWEKHNGTGLFNDRFRRVHELALHFYRDDVKWGQVFKRPQFTNDGVARTIRKKARPAHWIGATGDTTYRSEDGGPRLMRSVLFVRSEHGRALHPTQKPIGLVEPLLRYACPIDGHVLDPFAGSGTTGVIAQRLGMSCTLIEADQNYGAVMRQRLLDDGPLFDRGAAS